MEVYIGLDVHAHSTTAVVVGPTGKRLQQAVIETNREALEALLRSIEGERHVCFEEGNASEWLYEVVRPLATTAVCCQPTKRTGAKSDRRDAERLANALRVGTIEQPIFKVAGQMTALRAAVRMHRLITRDTTRVKNRIKAIYRGRGLTVIGDVAYAAATRTTWLAQLAPAYRELAEAMLAQLDVLVPLADRATQRVKEESQPFAAVDRLSTIPGIGPIRAAYITAIVVTPTRFRSKQKFWSYCGLAVTTESSGDWKRVRGVWSRTTSTKTRGLNRNRNPWLKEVFKAAALSVTQLRADHPMKVDYEQMILQGRRPNLARLTIARRLAATALSLWKKQEVYDYSKRHRPPNPKAA